MKLKNTLLSVKSIKTSEEFYKNVLGLRKIADFGANITLTGGLCLQSEKSWNEFIDNKEITYYSNNSEIYFETSDFDSFCKKLESIEIMYVHKVKEHSWGQRVVRFYDPDGHIIEVGEELTSVIKRFEIKGMTDEEIAKRMDVPLNFIIKNKSRG